jgi:hypothetical protein
LFYVITFILGIDALFDKGLRLSRANFLNQSVIRLGIDALFDKGLRPLLESAPVDENDPLGIDALFDKGLRLSSKRIFFL